MQRRAAQQVWEANGVQPGVHMKRKMTMQADELEEGMLIHHPSWITAPDRVAQIENVHIKGTRVRVSVQGMIEPFWVDAGEYVTTVVT